MGSAAPKIRFLGDYIFRIKIGVDKEIKELMRFAYNDLNSRNLAILHVQNDYGEGAKEFAIKEFKKLNGNVVLVEGFDVKSTDFRSQLIKIKNSKADIVLITAWPRNTGWILKQAKELDLNLQFIAPGGSVSPEIIEIAQDASNGLIYVLEFNTNSDNKKTKEFIKKFKNKYNREPELFAALGYDGVMLIAKAIEQCNLDSMCVKNNLYTTQNYEGVSGTISFDEYGDVERPLYYMTIKDEKFVVLE